MTATDEVAVAVAEPVEEDGGEDDGPIPRYPRSMLQFRISDGSTEIDAIEYRKIPELELGETPLGYKVWQTIMRVACVLTVLIISIATTERREGSTRHRILGTRQCHSPRPSRGGTAR